MIGWAAPVTAGMGAVVAAIAVTPILGVSPPTAPVGVTVHVSASARPSGVDYNSCTVYVDKTRVADCTVDANHELRASFPVPRPLVAGTSYPVTVCAGVCGGNVPVRSKGTFAAMGWLMVPTPALSLPPRAQAPTTVVVKGTGWSVGGKCSVTAGKITAPTCNVDGNGALSAPLPVKAAPQGGRLPVTVNNTVRGAAPQSEFATLTVIGHVTTAGPASPTPAPSSVPAVTAGNITRWPLSGPATGGLAVLVLILIGALAALTRWHPGGRKIPVVQVRLTTQPGYFPQLAGDRNSRIHAIHWQLRTEGPTMDGPRQ